MSQLSKLLKKLEKNISSASKKSGLRRIISKNRRALTGLALGGGIGGLVGLRRDKRKREEEKADLFKRKQVFKKGKAIGDLDKIIDDIRGPEDEEQEFDEFGRPINRPGTFPGEGFRGGDAFTPGSGLSERREGESFRDFLARQEAARGGQRNQQRPRDLIPNAPVELNRPGGGLDLGPGGAGKDEAKILAEAELAKKLQEEQFGAKKAERASALADLSKLLTQRGEREFTEITPGILEDLNTRGLLRSSALGDRFAKEKGRIESRSQEQIAFQSLADRGTSLRESTGILDQFLGSRQGALQRRFSLEDFARQTESAKNLGIATAPIQPFQSGGKGGLGDVAEVTTGVASIVGAGASVAKGGK